MVAAPLSIIYVSTEGLRPYPHNARTHSKHQIRQIANSIKEFGFTNPVLTDRNNTIIAGHGRVEAAKSIGIENVPTASAWNPFPRIKSGPTFWLITNWLRMPVGIDQSSPLNCSTF